MKPESPREISGIELDVDWNRRCAICFRKPTVIGRQGSQVVYSGHMCGVCLWGDIPPRPDPADIDSQHEDER